MEDSGSGGSATKDNSQRQKTAEVVEVIGMCARVVEDCCMLKCIFGGWNGASRRESTPEIKPRRCHAHNPISQKIGSNGLDYVHK